MVCPGHSQASRMMLMASQRERQQRSQSRSSTSPTALSSTRHAGETMWAVSSDALPLTSPSFADAYGYEMLDHDVGPRTDRAEISPLLSDPEAEPSEADYIAIGSSAPAAQPTLSAAAQEMLVTLEASGLTLDDLGGPQALETMVQQLQEDGPITLPPIVIVAVAQRAVSAYGLDYNERLRARLCRL